MRVPGSNTAARGLRRRAVTTGRSGLPPAESLSAESLSAESLSAESLSAESLSAESLSAESCPSAEAGAGRLLEPNSHFVESTNTIVDSNATQIDPCGQNPGLS